MSNQNDSDILYIFGALVGAAFIMFAALMLIAPTEEDVERCAEISNYTEAQCRFELSR